MLKKLQYYLKSTFGFSNRESRGFLLVLPALAVLYAVPSVYQKILDRRNVQRYESYLQSADSLVRAGWQPYQPSQTNVSTPSAPADSTKKKSSYQTPKTPSLNKISFSEADSVLLQIVPGIGPTLAGRIVKYRESLGGLHQKEQILEVYGMNPETMDKLFDYFAFEPRIWQRVKINEADAGTLASHPYISYGEAKVIVAFRNQHGPFRTADDLLGIKIFTKEWVARIAPYLAF